MSATNQQYLSMAKAVIESESRAVNQLANRLDTDFSDACDLLLNCRGRIIVTGMGKSSHIGSKVSATFSSTGAPSFFMHPGEASHGDMGMITSEDVVLAISHSGNTQELLLLVPLIKRLGVPLISITGHNQCPLANAADIALTTGVDDEACPLGLAPTTSTTCTLVLGDALAVALLNSRGFTEEDFALSHPGGALGRKLLLKIDDLMHQGNSIPRVNTETPLSDCLIEVSAKKLGITTVVDEEEKLVGVFTDGDLRRVLSESMDLHQTPVKAVMSTNVKTIEPGTLAASALQQMQAHKITALVVTNNKQVPVGLVDMHALLQAGVI